MRNEDPKARSNGSYQPKGIKGCQALVDGRREMLDAYNITACQTEHRPLEGYAVKSRIVDNGDCLWQQSGRYSHAFEIPLEGLPRQPHPCNG